MYWCEVLGCCAVTLTSCVSCEDAFSFWLTGCLPLPASPPVWWEKSHSTIVTYCSSGVPVDYTALQKNENKIICAGCRCLQGFRRSRKWIWCFCSTMFSVTQMLFAPWYVNNLLCHCGNPPLYQIVVSSYAPTLNSMCDLVQASSSQACSHQ